ncbi:hypothetical protein GQ42DRAFT_161697 [Ramicandelaber brevisporus]|nr:hypothetical protein GQ42DRAFT_161697 [Ramicandelaber brevisporus]
MADDLQQLENLSYNLINRLLVSRTGAVRLRPPSKPWALNRHEEALLSKLAALSTLRHKNRILAAQIELANSGYVPPPSTTMESLVGGTLSNSGVEGDDEEALVVELADIRQRQQLQKHTVSAVTNSRAILNALYKTPSNDYCDHDDAVSDLSSPQTRDAVDERIVQLCDHRDELESKIAALTAELNDIRVENDKVRQQIIRQNLLNRDSFQHVIEVSSPASSQATSSQASSSLSPSSSQQSDTLGAKSQKLVKQLKATLDELQKRHDSHKEKSEILRNVMQGLILESGTNWALDKRLRETMLALEALDI